MVERDQTAPDFIAPAVSDGQVIELELFRLIDEHDAVVLLFYPADFVPACTAELVAIRDAGWASNDDIAVVGLSGDSLFAHFAYADRFSLPFPLVSDFHGSIADSYGLLTDEWEAHTDISKRAVVVIDGEWTVRFVAESRDALDQVEPAPVERAGDAVAELDIDLPRPQVDFDGHW